MLTNPQLERVSVLCTACDPPATVHVRVGIEIPDPYICTTCQKRALRRLENATSPWKGRMAHGSGKGGFNDE
jgi:hypothetical protein